jgi:hypothetical protein
MPLSLYLIVVETVHGELEPEHLMQSKCKQGYFRIGLYGKGAVYVCIDSSL